MTIEIHREFAEKVLEAMTARQIEIELLDGSMTDRVTMNFDMEVYIDTNPKHRACGTVGCIAGWAYVVGHNFKIERNVSQGNVMDWAANHMFVDPNESWELFTPFADGTPHNIEYDEISMDDAIRALENLIEHGDPLWRTVLEDRI